MTPDEVRLHREERKKLSSLYKQLLNGVSAILFRHDAIGINFEDNTDEYDPEAGAILLHLAVMHLADVTLFANYAAST